MRPVGFILHSTAILMLRVKDCLYASLCAESTLAAFDGLGSSEYSRSDGGTNSCRWQAPGDGYGVSKPFSFRCAFENNTARLAYVVRRDHARVRLARFANDDIELKSYGNRAESFSLFFSFNGKVHGHAVWE